MSSRFGLRERCDLTPSREMTSLGLSPGALLSNSAVPAVK